MAKPKRQKQPDSGFFTEKTAKSLIWKYRPLKQPGKAAAS